MTATLRPARMIRAAFHVLVLITTAPLAAGPVAYHLNETIEVSTTGAWDKATVIEVGAAGSEHEGEYKVHFIGYAASYDRWLQPIYFRKVAAGAAPAAAAKAAYELNERIEVSTTGAWDKATVIEVGTAGGEHEGEYKVHFDGYAASYDRWLLPVYFRKVAGGAAATKAAPAAGAATASPASSTSSTPAADTDAGPRAGKYNIMSYGAIGRPPLFLGHIDMQAGGKYRISRRSTGDYYGEGTYEFDASTSTVKWLSGPCRDDGWNGTFTTDRGGKTHKIRLRSTTIATNSMD